MPGLVNFTTAIADGIAVLLPAFCYLAACGCFLFFAWTLWTWSEPHRRDHHHWQRPWVPWVSLILSGVFASFPQFLTMADVSAGTDLVVSLTTYTPTAPPNASNILGNGPAATVINVVTAFQHFFQAFGAACVFWAIMRWRAIIIGVRRAARFRGAVHQHCQCRHCDPVLLPERRSDKRLTVRRIVIFGAPFADFLASVSLEGLFPL
jgi:hypothetical protein